MTPPWTAIVQHYYPERREYLDDIIASIREASPSEIIIWDNSTTLHAPELGATVIRSSRNTLLGRYAAALVAETDIVYIQDDDLVVEPETIRCLVETAAEARDAIHGISGCNLSKDYPETPYSKARWVNQGSVDVVMGRAFACSRSALSAGLSKILHEGVVPGRSDDIWFSMQTRAFVIPNATFTNLDERGIGLSHDPQHLSERDAMARRLLEEL